jgi:hypothetical protein
MSNPLHSNATAEWYTPDYIIDAVRATLGEITLDPCSNEEANKVVGATFHYTADDDGLSKTWVGKVFVNPPSKCDSCEKRCTCKLPRRFMHRMFESYYEGCVTHAVYLGFNLGQLKYLDDMYFDRDDVRFCIPRKRIKFWQPGNEKNNPTQDNFVLLLSSCLGVRTRFDEAFSEIGSMYQAL